MRRLTITLAFLLVSAALAVGAAGCGGGSKSAAETSARTETTQATEMSEATETETSTEAGGFDFGSGDCRKLAEAGATIFRSLSPASTDKGSVEQTKRVLDGFAEKAPSEIKPDLRVLADAYAMFAAEFAKLNLKAGATNDAATVQRLQEALASLDDPKVQEASLHFTSWVTKNCRPSGG